MKRIIVALASLVLAGTSLATEVTWKSDVGTTLFWAKTISGGTPTLDASLCANYRLVTTENVAMSINGTEYLGTAYSIGKRGSFVIIVK